MSGLGNKRIMADNIRYYLQLNDISQKDICDALGFKVNTFSDWVNAKTYPRIDKIEMMANYFGIQKSDLIEEKKAPSISNKDGLPPEALQILEDLRAGKLSEKEMAVLHKLSFLSAEQKREIEAYIDFRLSQEKHQ